MRTRVTQFRTLPPVRLERILGAISGCYELIGRRFLQQDV